MNSIWQAFLTSHPANTITSDNALYSTPQLSILKVSGNDAPQFLQGQLTCNVKDLSATNSFFAGICNPKGRVISTLLILKQGEIFLMILPTVLFDKVKTTLAKYILRSKVVLENGNDEYCLSGLTSAENIATTLSLPESRFSRNDIYLKLANSHYLLINRVADSINRWTELVTYGLQIQNSQLGQFLDLNAGLAWLDDSTSEEYIPQMLNLDKLGGISLTKGCYTGQEVVARTHYLGKSKRELYLAEAEADAILAADKSVIDAAGQVVGKILTWQIYQNTCRLLLVMQTTEIEATQLRLNTAKQDKINLISFATI